jgi:hypothetical protein
VKRKLYRYLLGLVVAFLLGYFATSFTNANLEKRAHVSCEDAGRAPKCGDYSTAGFPLESAFLVSGVVDEVYHPEVELNFLFWTILFFVGINTVTVVSNKAKPKS